MNRPGDSRGGLLVQSTEVDHLEATRSRGFCQYPQKKDHAPTGNDPAYAPRETHPGPARAMGTLHGHASLAQMARATHL